GRPFSYERVLELSPQVPRVTTDDAARVVGEDEQERGNDAYNRSFGSHGVALASLEHGNSSQGSVQLRVFPAGGKTLYTYPSCVCGSQQTTFTLGAEIRVAKKQIRYQYMGI